MDKTFIIDKYIVHTRSPHTQEMNELMPKSVKLLLAPAKLIRMLRNSPKSSPEDDTSNVGTSSLFSTKNLPIIVVIIIIII